DYLAERIDRAASVRAGRLTDFEGMQSLLPDLIPAWGAIAGRHIIVVGPDRRILARTPTKSSLDETDGILDAISSAQLIAAPSLQGKILDMTLPNGNRAMATSQLVKALSGRVIVIQERLEPIWGSDSALSVTLAAASSGRNRCSPCSGSTAATIS